MSHFFLYARKSTDTEEKQVLSIEAQLTELRLFAKKENLTIKEELTEKMSAKTPGRPIFNQMIERIEGGEAQGIIAWHPDRLARNSVDGGRIIYLLDSQKLQYLKFPTFWFDNTPQGKFMMSIAFGQSKYYIDNLAENIKRGFRQKLRRGEWPSKAPFGYNNDRALRKVVLDPNVAPFIKKLFETYASDKVSLLQLKQLAPQWGLLSFSGRELEKQEIHRILTNPFYYGLMKYSEEYSEGNHEPIVTKDLFDRVQVLLSKPCKPRKIKKHRFPLIGLAVCYSCGYSVTAERKKGHTYYHCTKKGPECHEPFVREELLAAQMRKMIEQVTLPDSLYQKLLSEWVKERNKTGSPVRLLKDERKKSLSEIQMRIDRLLDTYLGNMITQAEYQAKREALLNEKIALEEKIAKVEQSATGWLEPCRAFLEAAHGARKLLEEENLEAQKEFCQKIGSNHRLAAKALVFDFNSPWLHLAAADAAAPGGGIWDHTKKIGSNYRLARASCIFPTICLGRISPAASICKTGGSDGTLLEPRSRKSTPFPKFCVHGAIENVA